MTFSFGSYLVLSLYTLFIIINHLIHFRIPAPEEPNYKYKNDVVRKKSERKQLNAFDCKECEKV